MGNLHLIANRQSILHAEAGKPSSPMFSIEYTETALADLDRLRSYESRRILDIIKEQLRRQPLEKTRNKKPLVGLVPPWESQGLVRELRIGAYRVFYEVDEAEQRVVIHGVRHKPAGKRTEDIL